MREIRIITYDNKTIMVNCESFELNGPFVVCKAIKGIVEQGEEYRNAAECPKLLIINHPKKVEVS